MPHFSITLHHMGLDAANVSCWTVKELPLLLIEIHKFENGTNQPMSISIIVGVVAFWMNIPHTMRELKSTKLHFTQTQASSVPEFQPIALFSFIQALSDPMGLRTDKCIALNL